MRGMEFTRWLKPTLLGPLLTLWTLTTLGSILVGMAALSGHRIDGWLTGMVWTTFFGSTLGVILVGVDVLLLRLRFRQLPTGTRAWISSILAPFAVFFIWTLPFLPPPESVAGVVAFVMLPMAAASFLVRVLFGQRP